jgi:hypothetical protein
MGCAQDMLVGCMRLLMIDIEGALVTQSNMLLQTKRRGHAAACCTTAPAGSSRASLQTTASCGAEPLQVHVTGA